MTEMSADVVYRKASAFDSDAILALENNCMSHPWNIQLINDLLCNPNGGAFVACFNNGNDVKGYVGYTYVLDEMEIGNICVMEDCRRMGVAMGLIDTLVKFCSEHAISKIFLEVNSTNYGAISLYDKFGFVKYSERKDYYGKGQNADMMVLSV